MSRPVPPDLLLGTLDLLILRIIARESMHGYGIAHRLKALSNTITRAGRRHLTAERQEFDQLVAAIRQVLETA